ncbi:MAG: TonB-dependent receptor [Candidatus Latescibacteria bacterium]|nr:TonB-dependent receptor [Candidatus Latescibacterota bacterium]
MAPASGLVLVLHLVCLVLLAARSTRAQTAAEVYRFFAEEARVITASRIPQAANRAPATVYVISGEQLRTSGAQTLWDVLRAVPGVDVALFRTYQGRVSIRGLNKSFNGRTLLLVDGTSTMQHGAIDQSLWEHLPVLPEEVERIEVVEGPASALYGANALNGVINIVTKKPGQLGGGLLSFGTGERRTRHASLLYGRQQGKVGYRFGLAWRTTNRFEDANLLASETYFGNGYLSYDLGPRTQLRLTGGLTDLDAQSSADWLSLTQSKGTVGFLRAEGVHRQTRANFFWSNIDNDMVFTAYDRQTNERHHTYDFNVEQLISLSAHSTAVVGTGVRDSGMRSSYVSANSSLWSAFAEHPWQPAPRWELWTSARVDRKSHIRPALSPRFSLIFTPVPAQTLRLSLGTAYRNPTVLENHLSFTDNVVVEEVAIAVESTGNPDLKPERIKSLELAYQLERGPFKATLVGFAYQLEDLIYAATSGVTLTSPTDVAVRFSYRNQGVIEARGGEAGMEFPWGRRITGFANYSYQDLSGTMDPTAAGYGTPHHKVNGGLRYTTGAFTANTSAHWVSHTRWYDNYLPNPRFQRVAAYTLVNLHLGYAFAGFWRGLELSLDAFNLFDHQHYESLPSKYLGLGQSAEIIRARRTVNMSYRF